MKPLRAVRLAAAAALALGTAACDGANEIVAPFTYEVSGTVRDLAGRPSGAVVIATSPSGELGRAAADPESGGYSIGGLPAGNVSLTAFVAGCSPVRTGVTLPAPGPVDFRIESCGWGLDAPGARTNPNADRR